MIRRSGPLAKVGHPLYHLTMEQRHKHIEFDDILDPELTGARRKSVMRKVYLRTGLVMGNWSKSGAAAYLGYTPKTVDDQLKEYQELNQEYKNNKYKASYNDNPEIPQYRSKQGKTMKQLADEKIRQLEMTWWFQKLEKEEREAIIERWRKIYVG